MTILISIQGNIGSGKSSLLKNLENYDFDLSKKKFVFFKNQLMNGKPCRMKII